MTSPISLAIQELQPLIQKLSETCSESNIMDLTNAIKSTSPLVLQKLHSFILVPLFGELIDCSRGVNIKLSLLECALSVLKVVHLSDVSVIINLVNVLMMQLFDKKSPTMICTVSEELKLSTLHCTLAIIDNMTQDARDHFYEKSNIPVICQISYTCIQIAESEKFRTLRLCAMEVILSLLHVPKSSYKMIPSKNRKNIGDVFQFVLPGASSKLGNIIAGDITQGSQVIQAAVLTLSSMITLVMEDYDLEEVGSVSEMFAAVIQKSRDITSQEKHEKCEMSFSKDKVGMQKLINSSPGRSSQWRENVAQHLIPCLNKIAALHSHSNPKVCREVAHSCGLLLLHCPISLREALPPLLDSLIILSIHYDIGVREECQIIISKLQESFLGPNSFTFLDLVEENFYMLITRLPRLVQEDGGSRATSAVVLLTGYIHLLHSSIKKVLSSSVHLQRLTLSLLHSLTIDCSSVAIGQEYTVRKLISTDGESLNMTWIQFRYNSDNTIISTFKNLCSVIADPVCGATDMLVPQLIDTFLSVPFFLKESILALNLILLSLSEHPNDDTQQFALSLLDLYLAPEFWIPQEQLTIVTSINQLQNDIAVACLLAEGVGCCAQALGERKTKPRLLHILYPLLERAGSANAAVSLAGRHALTRVALSCGYGRNLMALLGDNMDYVTHCMALSLSNASEQCGVLDALSMILQHSSPALAITLRDVVYNVLRQSVCHVKSNEAHLRVFLTYASGVRKWLEPECYNKELVKDSLMNVIQKLQDDVDLEKVSSVVSPESSFSTWNAWHKLKEYQFALKLEMIQESHSHSKELNEINNDQQTTNEAEGSQEDAEDHIEEPRKKEAPELVKLLVLVLQRCIHFLSSNAVDHQFLSLETIQAGLLALETYPDTLLPIVHQIWNPLTGRLLASQPPLIIRAGFRLLLTMACTARDFLASRTIREVLPQLTTFLKNSVHHSRLQDQGSAFRYSQMYKTQLALLVGLGPLASHLRFQGEDLYSILIAALPFLSCFQPQPLQVACKALVLSFFELDADATWWALVTWWTPSELASTLQLPKVCHRDDCKENVTALLQMVENS